MQTKPTDAPDVKIWRVYRDGEIKNETRVLYPHMADGLQCTGYDGDVDAWSKHNQNVRPGCAQIVQYGDDTPAVLYNGYLSDDELAEIVSTLGGK